MPWRQKAVEAAQGSGFLIEGGRIVTNAHVVDGAEEVSVTLQSAAGPGV